MQRSCNEYLIIEAAVVRSQKWWVSMLAILFQTYIQIRRQKTVRPMFVLSCKVE
jgi:hypothetical protein